MRIKYELAFELLDCPEEPDTSEIAARIHKLADAISRGQLGGTMWRLRRPESANAD